MQMVIKCPLHIVIQIKLPLSKSYSISVPKSRRSAPMISANAQNLFV